MFEVLKADKRLREAEETISQLQRRVTALEVEWTDTLDRLKTMQGRILKERSRTEQARADMGLDQASPAHVRDEDVDAGPSSLTPRQISLNAQIIARRKRLSQ